MNLHITRKLYLLTRAMYCQHPLSEMKKVITYKYFVNEGIQMLSLDEGLP